jgi:clan AA aspartic protease (TIGR02281 family)
MTNFPPGDYEAPVPRERTIGSWVFAVVFMTLLVGSGWIYQFRPQWVAMFYGVGQAPLQHSPDRHAQPASMSRIPTAAQNDGSDTEFAALYQKYGMTSLRTSVARSSDLSSSLVNLQKAPCDKQAIFQASLALESTGSKRAAAEMLKGFADACPDGDGERYRASELYYLLGDFDMAVRLSSAIIDHQPDAQSPYFVRAKSEQSLERYAAAIEDYTTLIQLMPDTKSIVSEVFMRLSDSYDKLNRPCQAIGPIQTYIELDSEKRSTSALVRRVAELAAKGNCTQVYAKGVARVRRANGVSIARAEINGVEGMFVVDTGASFVTLTQSFANRAKPQIFKTDSIAIQTANGTTSAKLGSVDSVKLDGLYASGVPIVITSKSLGNGVDGLLGMSFLSRFDVVIQDHEIELKAKTPEE